jgi:DNA repair protein RadC
MAIRDWPAAERPRERLTRHGAAALSDAELLAIFLRVGVARQERRRSRARPARQLRRRPRQPGRRHNQGTRRLPGIGPAKAAQLAASLELARRALAAPLKLKDALARRKPFATGCDFPWANLPHEVFVALWLDAQNRLIASEELFRGTLTQTSVYPREVVKRALANNAGAVILAHNHPSGLAEPSRADEVLTSSLKQALALVDVKLLDHFIVAGGARPLSFAERGLI